MKTIQNKILVILSLGTLALSGCGHNGGQGVNNPKNSLTDLGDDTSAHITALSQQYSLSIGVDIRDVSHYKAALGTEATTLVASMKSNPKLYFPAGVKFLSAGPTVEQSSQKNSVYGVEFADFELSGDGKKMAVVNALFHTDSGGFTFSTFNILFSADGSKIEKIDFIRDLPLSQAHFTVQLGLMQRKIILQDTEHNIRKIYAIGIGGFDLGVEKMGTNSPLTPKIKTAVLEKAEAMFSRTYPAYFSGRPFIRISSGVGGYTPFGLHYSITDELVRGFVSHGCIRMRDKDLYELYYVLNSGADAVLPLEMRYWLKDLADTPYPLDDSEYQRVKNFGTVDNPETKRDKDDLVILEQHHGPPPEDTFVDNLARLMNLQN